MSAKWGTKPTEPGMYLMVNRRYPESKFIMKYTAKLIKEEDCGERYWVYGPIPAPPRSKKGLPE